jgi:hypothetical protein
MIPFPDMKLNTTHLPIKKQKWSELQQQNHRAKSITNLGLIFSEGVETEAAFGVIEESEALICLWDWYNIYNRDRN